MNINIPSNPFDMNVLMPLFIKYGLIFLGIIIVLSIVKVVIVKLTAKLTAKSKIEKDIEEAKYWKRINEMADQELKSERPINQNKSNPTKRQ